MAKTVRRCLVLALLGGAIFALGWRLAVALSHQPAPAIRLSSQRLDLGEGRPGARVSGTLRIENLGDEPLEFQVHGSCGCMELSPQAGTVAPGEAEEVRVVVALPGTTDSERSVRILVSSNDPKEPQIQCVAVVRSQGPLTVKPSEVDFGQVLREEVGSAVRVIRVAGAKGEDLRDLARVQVRCQSGSLRVSKESAPGGGWQLRVSLSPSLSRGDLFDTIELQPEGSQEKVQVPVRARLVEDLTVAPSTVFLRSDATTGKYRTVDLFLVSGRVKAAPGPISIVGGPQGVRIEEVQVLDPLRRRLRLSVPAPLPEQEADLRLRCEGVEGVFSVRLVRPSLN